MNALDHMVSVPGYMRLPSWRWNIALRCMIDSELTTEEAIRRARAAEDTWLVQACSFFRNRISLATGKLVDMMSTYPAMVEAFHIQRDSKEGGFRWIVEALLMTDATYEEIARYIGCLSGAETIEMYSKVYFDVSLYKHNVPTIFSTVLANSRKNEDDNSDCDYTWKVLAYQGGFESFTEFLKFQAGGVLPDSLLQAMQTISNHRRLYATYHRSLTLKSCLNQEAMATFQLADSKWKLDKDSGMTAETLATLTASTVLDALGQCLLDPGIEKQVASNNHFTEPGISDKFVPTQALYDRVHPVSIIDEN